jgi:16S rRNA (adenine1518-N6/adenine1519-N6)-dimethyltransferase
MNLTSPTTIKEILAKYETRPSKGLGQNFLIDKNVLRKIVEAADIKKDDIILEVGPGMGTLTREIGERAKKIIAVEKSDVMCEVLKETINDFKNVEVLNTDILGYEPSIKEYKVVANIPYYLTSPLIRKFLEEKNPPQEIILMIQKEVAQRICAKPPQMSLLAISVQFYAEAKIISYVSKNCFWPAPKIDSAIIKITPKINADKNKIDIDSFFKVVKSGFSHPRKQLVNNLTTLKSLDDVKLTKDQISSWLLANNLSSNQRAETLDVSDWINLTKSFLNFKK